MVSVDPTNMLREALWIPSSRTSILVHSAREAEVPQLCDLSWPVQDDIIRSNSMVLRSLQSIHIERASRSPSENTPTPRSASLHIESPSSKATHRKTRAIDDFFAENALHAAGDMQLANTTLGGGNDMAALGLAQRQLSTTQVLENIANSEGIRNVLVRCACTLTHRYTFRGFVGTSWGGLKIEFSGESALRDALHFYCFPLLVCANMQRGVA